MEDLEILMMDGCTYKEAQDLLRNGSVVFRDFEKCFNQYMEEWGADEEQRKAYKKMINEKIPVEDWGIVEFEGKTYYIMYVL